MPYQKVGTLRYKEPQDLEDGQVLGRAHIGIFKDNDDYFHGLADAIRTPAPGLYSVSSDLQWYNIWDGWVLVESDCYYLNYECSHTGDVYLYVDQPGNSSYLVTNNPTAGEFSMLSHGYQTTGLRRVTFTVRDDDGVTGVTIRPPYLRYTGPNSPTWQGAQSFSGTSSETEWQKLATNDQWLHYRRPRQAATKAVRSNYPAGSGETYNFWNGWYQHYSGYNTVYYHLRCYTDEWVQKRRGDSPNWNPGDNKVVLYEQSGATLATCTATAADGGYQDLEGTATLSGSYGDNEIVRLYANLERSGTDDGAWGWVRYVLVGKSSPASDYTDMTVPTLASSDGGPTGSDGRVITGDLSALGTNDTSLYNRLINRYDFGVQTCTTDRNREEWYRLKRRGDWLLWRGTNVELSWGGKYSLMLGSADNPYGTVDLVSLKGLHYGMIYTLESRGGTLEYAMEY